MTVLFVSGVDVCKRYGCADVCHMSGYTEQTPDFLFGTIPLDGNQIWVCSVWYSCGVTQCPVNTHSQRKNMLEIKMTC